jgi:hypothetical protein
MYGWQNSLNATGLIEVGFVAYAYPFDWKSPGCAGKLGARRWSEVERADCPARTSGCRGHAWRDPALAAVWSVVVGC